MSNVLDYIKTFFSYNSKTGVVTRFDRKNSNGSFDTKGYLIIKIKGTQYKAHRIAWFLHYGIFPENVIDHKNGNRSDNRISNLTDVSQDENNKSTARRNFKLGKIGIYEDNVTRGLKKRFTFKIDNRTYRYYNLNDAMIAKEKMLKELT